MKLTSINPINGNKQFEVDCWTENKLRQVVDSVCSGGSGWANTPLQLRTLKIQQCGELLRKRKKEFATLITTEMGKVIKESELEIDKCIFTCEYYAENAELFLRNDAVDSDASRSYVHYQPIGTVLGIMPWNFPFWQVFRFAIPAMASGNTVLLKHASNVPQSSLAVEQLLHQAGIPENVYRSLMINSSQLSPLYSDPRIRGIAVTGSEKTGRHVATQAGAHLKKVVLELGGSDAFIVLDDANIEEAVDTALTSRFFTSGQSCINAKRIILVNSIAEKFMALFTQAVEKLKFGDPNDPQTRVGPMVRSDLRQKLHHQVTQSIKMGAVATIGCQPIDGPGYFYPPSILDNVHKGMPAYEEEIFGPVACIIHAENEQQAIRIANDTEYGLGSSIWTNNTERGERVASQIEAGMVYINGLVKSDPRLAFGGIKNSGFGRELGRYGMMEFINAKTIWVG